MSLQGLDQVNSPILSVGQDVEHAPVNVLSRLRKQIWNSIVENNILCIGPLH